MTPPSLEIELMNQGVVQQLFSFQPNNCFNCLKLLLLASLLILIKLLPKNLVSTYC